MNRGVFKANRAVWEVRNGPGFRAMAAGATGQVCCGFGGAAGFLGLGMAMEKKRFTELGLSEELVRAVHGMGFEEATPIQSMAIPVLLGGADAAGQSQTGSGKTVAFALPAIERVDPELRAPQVLILCPTRELAIQVAEEVAKLAAFKQGVRELPVYGGQGYDRQIRGLKKGAQIIIGTPGRIMDHLERGTLRLDAIRMVVLDECDRMLDMGFVDDIRSILKTAPPERQTVLFSATMPRGIQELLQTFTRGAVRITVPAHAAPAPDIEQIYYEVDRRSKLEALCRVIDVEEIGYAIIFCATKMMVDELAEHLNARGYAADRMHGDITQQQRERVIAKFRNRGLEFLVATDVAARGLDVDDVEVVFNYDLPHDGEDYIHRIGRTGRAGRSGKAVSFVAGREIYRLEAIMRTTRARIRRAAVPSAEEVEEKRKNAFYDTLREVLEKGAYPRHDALVDRLLGQDYSPTDIASALIYLAQEQRPAPPLEASAPERPRRAPTEKGRAPDPARRGPPRDREDSRGYGRVRDAERAGRARIAVGVGRDHGLSPEDVLGLLAEVAGVRRESVGTIRIERKRTVVDVDNARADEAVARLGGIKIGGRLLWCKRVN